MRIPTELRLTAHFFPHLENLVANHSRYGWELSYFGSPVWFKDYFFSKPIYLAVLRRKKR